VASDQPHSPRMGVSFLSFGQGGLAVWQQGRLRRPTLTLGLALCDHVTLITYRP